MKLTNRFYTIQFQEDRPVFTVEWQADAKMHDKETFRWMIDCLNNDYNNLFE